MSNPIVTFEMENGKTIKAELYPEIAPNTVNNFLSLVNRAVAPKARVWAVPDIQSRANLP